MDMSTIAAEVTGRRRDDVRPCIILWERENRTSFLKFVHFTGLLVNFYFWRWPLGLPSKV